MIPRKIGLAVALDGGTTNTRARLVRDREIVATCKRAVGVRDAVLDSARSPLASAVRESLAEAIQAGGGIQPDLIVAAGMLSAEVGLLGVPHVLAPVDSEQLAQGAAVRILPEVSDLPIIFVTGVRTPAEPGLDGWAAADVMRGEECETIGAWQLLNRGSRAEGSEQEALTAQTTNSRNVFVWPGSHTKLVEVDGSGVILRSHSTLAGELTAALANHTLLAASLEQGLPEAPDPEAARVGARLVRNVGLGRAAYLVRVSALQNQFNAHERASFLVGALIADDVDHLARHSMFRTASQVWVGGRQPQRSLYTAELRGRLESPVEELEARIVDQASTIGALGVAARLPEDLWIAATSGSARA